MDALDNGRPFDTPVWAICRKCCNVASALCKECRQYDLFEDTVTAEQIRQRKRLKETDVSEDNFAHAPWVFTEDRLPNFTEFEDGVKKRSDDVLGYTGGSFIVVNLVEDYNGRIYFEDYSGNEIKIKAWTELPCKPYINGR